MNVKRLPQLTSSGTAHWYSGFDAPSSVPRSISPKKGTAAKAAKTQATTCADRTRRPETVLAAVSVAIQPG